jgi:hypothetical protein
MSTEARLHADAAPTGALRRYTLPAKLVSLAALAQLDVIPRANQLTVVAAAMGGRRRNPMQQQLFGVDLALHVPHAVSFERPANCWPVGTSIYTPKFC